MDNAEVTVAKPIFVLVIREVLVAQDIAMVIRDLQPDAEIVMARTLDDAARGIPEGRVVSAFVQMRPAAFQQSLLAQRAMADGAKIMLVDQDDAALAALPCAKVLRFPFTRDDVANLLLDIRACA